MAGFLFRVMDHNHILNNKGGEGMLETTKYPDKVVNPTDHSGDLLAPQY